MKIAFIGQKGIPVSQGGVERHVEELAKSLCARGHETIVYSRNTYEKGDGQIPKEIKVIELPSIPVKAWDTIIHTFLATVDVLFRKVDIIHYHSLGPAFFMWVPWLFKPSATLVFTHHTYETQRPQWGFLARAAMKLGEKVGMFLADEVIAISPTVAMDLESIYKRRVAMVPNGVSRLSQGTASGVQLPEKYILTVSRLIRSKGLDHLINAFNLMSKDYPNYHLVIVGAPTKNDSDEERLRSLAKDNARIHFLGYQPSSRLSEIYKKADVFVQPSEIEGLPITLLEAAGTGVPVIVSDIPEHMVIVRSDALAFRSKNHIDLAAKIRMALDDLPRYKVSGRLLAERINSEFGWQHITRKIENLYFYSHKRNQKISEKAI